MPSGEQRRYDHAQLAQGSGNLVDITGMKWTLTNGGKFVHTKGGSGFVLGNRESEVSFDSKITEDGPERDYWKDCQRGTMKQLRVKISGRTFVYNGIYTKVDGDGPLDDTTMVSCTFIGIMEDL